MYASLTKKKIAHALSRLVAWRELSKRLTVDKGREFADKYMDGWAYWRKIKLDTICRRKPTPERRKEPAALHGVRRLTETLCVPPLTRRVSAKSNIDS